MTALDIADLVVHGTTDSCTAHLLLAQYHDGTASRTLVGPGATEDRVRDTVARYVCKPGRACDAS